MYGGDLVQSRDVLGVRAARPKHNHCLLADVTLCKPRLLFLGAASAMQKPVAIAPGGPSEMEKPATMRL